MSSPHRTFLTALLALASAGLACAQAAIEKPAYVRVEPREAGAPDNSHPFALSASALKQSLAGLKVVNTVSHEAVPVFTEDELEDVVPAVAAALAKATRSEDVTFAVTGKHGLFGKFSPRSVTSARLFARDGELNAIFGLVHERYENGELGAGPPSFRPGTRARRLDSVWKIVADGTVAAQRRAGWVILAVAPPSVPRVNPRAPDSAAPAAPAPAPVAPAIAPGTPAAPAASDEGRFQEVVRRLRVIERLKAEGLITEEEYRERRRAILQGI